MFPCPNAAENDTRHKCLVGNLPLQLFLLSVLAGTPRVLWAQNEDRQKADIGLVATTGLGFVGGPAACTISNVSEAIRTVPIHPDDTYARISNAGPIADSLLDCPGGTLDTNAMLGVSFRAGRMRVRIAATGSYTLVASGDINRRNYTNAVGTDTRGTGAALTYYGPTTNGLHWLSFSPGADMQIAWAVRDGQLNQLAFVEYAIQSSSVYVETGWDRYDALEARDAVNVATAILRTTRVGWEVSAARWSWRVYVAYVIPDLRNTQVDEFATVSSSRRVVGGMNLSFGKPN